MEKEPRYQGVIWRKNGTKSTTGTTNSRSQAEKMAYDLFERETRLAVHDFFKPTRYEVIEKK